jgi:predicted transposase/invertase (TIGR01784 family)
MLNGSSVNRETQALFYEGRERKFSRLFYPIKRLLRSKANYGILEGFLSELLKQDIKILSLPESESNKEDKDGKLNRVDVIAKLATDEIVLIEVQVNTETDYFLRMLFGVSKIVVEHLKEGEPYSQIKKVYSVNILYFDLGHGNDYVYHGTTSFSGIHSSDILDLTETQKEVFRKEKVSELYPEYYIIKVNQFNEIARDTLDQWIYFLKTEEIKDSFHAKGLIEAKEKLDSLKLNPKDKEEYKRYVENLSYQKSMVISNYEEGRVEGEAKGRAEGEATGIAKGEKTKAIEIAKSMKNAGVNKDMILQLAGLSEEEVAKIFAD